MTPSGTSETALPETPLFDSHLHIIDPRFPLQGNRGYRPEPFRVADYRAATAGLDIRGGAVVSGSFQGFDQQYLLAALAELGPGFVGVTNLPENAPDEEIRRLDGAGVRAVRVNLRRGPALSARHIRRLAERVHALAGWHLELYADSRDLADLVPMLQRLPRLSIDHLGLSEAGLPTLLRLAEAGVRIKASGFGRLEPDLRSALAQLHRANPEALMFGTDLPGTRAPRPFHPDDLRLLAEAIPARDLPAVLRENARAFYRL